MASWERIDPVFNLIESKIRQPRTRSPALRPSFNLIEIKNNMNLVNKPISNRNYTEFNLTEIKKGPSRASPGGIFKGI